MPMLNKVLPNNIARTLILIGASAALSACQSSEQQTTSELKFSVPTSISQVRAVDENNLQPLVTLSNGQSVPMERNGDNTWTGTVNVQPSDSYAVTVVWNETLPKGDLELARWNEAVFVGDTGAQLNLGDSDYDYSADLDGDNISNIDERVNETDPFLFNGQAVAPVNPSDATNGTASGTSGGTTVVVPDPSNSDGATVGASTTPAPDSEQTTPPTTPDEEAAVTTSQPIMDAMVIIPRIAVRNAPGIDGANVTSNAQGVLSGEWASAVQTTTDNERLFINNLMVDAGAEDDDGAPLRRWAAMHDGVNLYVLVLSDDTGARFGDSEDIFEDDAIEVFIDADHSQLNVWGDADDFHYMIPLLGNTSTIANRTIDGRIQKGPMSSSVDLNIDYYTGPGKGPDGIRAANWEQDVYEIAIPMAEAGITPGTLIGFEMQLDDDDNGGGRESKWGWFHPSRQGNVDTDTTYTNPSVMGTVFIAN